MLNVFCDFSPECSDENDDTETDNMNTIKNQQRQNEKHEKMVMQKVFAYMENEAKRMTKGRYKIM